MLSNTYGIYAWLYNIINVSFSSLKLYTSSILLYWWYILQITDRYGSKLLLWKATRFTSILFIPYNETKSETQTYLYTEISPYCVVNLTLIQRHIAEYTGFIYKTDLLLLVNILANKRQIWIFLSFPVKEKTGCR